MSRQKIFSPIFIDSSILIFMICNKCNGTMKYMSGAQNGGYHICKKCNYLELSTIPYDIDKVADRGRD
jgi:formylmethanofuran dehydrogenase subunit E